MLKDLVLKYWNGIFFAIIVLAFICSFYAQISHSIIWFVLLAIDGFVIPILVYYIRKN